MLLWVDLHPWVHFFVVTVGLGCAGFIVLRSIYRGGSRPHSDISWALLIFFLLFLGRGPSLFVTRQINTDEGLQLAGAATLRHDPLFWRSVFGTTTGPLDFYALLPVGTLAGIDTFFSARLTGLILLGGTLIFTHQILVRAFGRTVARIATLPTLSFEAFSIHPDFLHYSTELLPLCLLSASICYGLARYSATGIASSWKEPLSGFLLSCAPFAKLQAAPLAGFVGFALAIAAWRVPPAGVPRYQPFLLLLCGASIPFLVATITLLVSPDPEGAWTSLVSANIAYVQNGFGATLQTLARLFSRLQEPGTLFLPWLGGVGGLSLVLLFWVRKADQPSRFLLIGATILFIVSIACIATPRRPFPHYMQLAVVPLTLVFGISLGITHRHFARTSVRFCRLICWATAILPLVGILLDRGLAPQPLLRRNPAEPSPSISRVAGYIQHYVDPGEPLAVWGWNAEIYVETGTRQATRHAMTDLEILINPYSTLFRDRYVKDFAKSLPPVFLDASFVRNNIEIRDMAHDVSLPELGTIVNREYELAKTIDEVRIFVRKDRFATRAPPSKT
ncbi:MAG: hypothetical protein ABIZ04_22780 [Opitutus sp.]